MPFPSARTAEIAYNSLRVDKELGRSGVTRSIEVIGSELKMLVICVHLYLFAMSRN